MAGFFATDYFIRHAEMMQSAMSDEEIARQMSLLYSSKEKAPAVSSKLRADRASTSSSSSSRGINRITEAEEDFLCGLGINAVRQEKSQHCALCAMSKPRSAFLSTKNCVHEFCTACLTTHAEVALTLTKTAQIKCPHPSCRRHFDIDQCRGLLSEASFKVFNLRLIGLEEAATPASQRVYCPFSSCSVFVPTVRKPESNRNSDTFVECPSCRRGFCLECGVPWESQCGVCTRRVPHTEFIAAQGCAHKYCTDCCKQYAEAEMHWTPHSQIGCPHPGCTRTFDSFQCKQLLSEAGFEVLSVREVVATIPVAQRVYCPFPECAAFIPILRPDGSPDCTLVKCHSCSRGICLECNVPWEKECDICADVVAHSDFISTKDCVHEYCTACCRHHAEVRILSGSAQVDCPHPDCAHAFHISQCATLLSAPNFDILGTRLTEAAIPAAHKVFCPFQDCSILMERSEDEGGDPFVVCFACHRGFCLECKVPWHGSFRSCAEYRAQAENAKQGGDEKLRELAKENKWQVCPDCAVVVELKSGCYHITCRCGTEFCYLCQKRWENKKPTCKCKLWDERNIIARR